MSRHDEVLELAEELITDIELSSTSTSKHVLKAARLARLTRNSDAQEWLSFELSGVPSTVDGRAWMVKTRRYSDKENGKGYWGSSASIESTRDAFKSALAGHAATVSLSGDGVLGAMNGRARQINELSGYIAQLDKVLSAVDAITYQFAAETYDEVKFSAAQATVFDRARELVDGRLATTAGQSLRMVDSVTERLGSDDPAAVSQAMTTCRQLIDSVANHLFPPRADPYDVGGRELLVTADKVKNRLNAYIHSRGVTGGRAARLGNGLNHLYDRVSAGVHDAESIDGREAEFLFLNTYMLLGEILTLDSPRPDDPSPAALR
ncbi:hypothetical protein [Microbacterium sp. Y-01]|uniref:AbiTii domain-containing protein n=1 Tax=Microbacterium sp. Y-01 TaxID=2048898 RepID=UPI000F5F8E67|nr:hypothetical protein [Microbacterium sp. Y-01]